MTSLMLHSEQMNATIELRLTAQLTINIIALTIFSVAIAASKLDLASSAPLPNEAGAHRFA